MAVNSIRAMAIIAFFVVAQLFKIEIAVSGYLLTRIALSAH